MPEKDYKSSEEFRELSDRVQEPQGKAPISPSKDRSLPRRNFLKVLGGISLVGILGGGVYAIGSNRAPYMVLTGKVKSITSLSQDPNNSLRMFVLEEKPNIDFYVNSGAVSDPAVPINLFGPPLRRNAKVVGAHIKETRSGDIVELCALESPRRINEDQRTFFVTGYINKSYYERLSPRLHLEL